MNYNYKNANKSLTTLLGSRMDQCIAMEGPRRGHCPLVKQDKTCYKYKEKETSLEDALAQNYGLVSVTDGGRYWRS